MVHQETITIETTGHRHMHDLTSRVAEVVAASKVYTGTVQVFNVGSTGAVRKAMKDRGILVGRDFPPYLEWLRVSIGTPTQMETFMAALREFRGRAAA